MNKIIQGDCVEVMKNTPRWVWDLVVASPPYGTARDYKGYTFDFDKTAEQLFRIIKPGGVVCWVVGDTVKNGAKSGEPYRQALGFMDWGFTLHDTIIMNKSGTSYPSQGRYTGCYEFIHVLSKGKPKTLNIIKDVPKKWAGSWGKTKQRKKDGTLVASTSKNCGAGKSGRAKGDEYGYKARTNIWDVITGKGFAHSDGDLAYQHPATFPTPLAVDLIKSYSDPGDQLADIFVGSGTTCVAARMTGRDCVGIDVSQEYCDLAEERVALAERVPS